MLLRRTRCPGHQRVPIFNIVLKRPDDPGPCTDVTDPATKRDTTPHTQ